MLSPLVGQLQDVSFLQAFLAFLVTAAGGVLGLFGGAGFFIQPALLAIGVPPHMVVAHDASATAGASATSFHVFNKHGKVDYKLLVWWLPGVLIGPPLGVALLSILSPEVLEKVIIGLSFVGAVAMLFKKKDWGVNAFPKPTHWKCLSLLSGLLLGVWSGFSGMGTGTISLMLLIFVFGQTIKQATAVKTPIHLVMESLTAAVFLFKGWLLWQLFFPMLAGCLVAGYIRAHLILRLSEKLLKTIFMISVFIIGGVALFKP
ncbi:MAG: sulfite exporter TauE/SafE family protein [Alphaproteobacteria bacterium]|nr:sulfite exporter TauE/SafE family protein [Alphaproteobacteria bacterium]